MSREPTPLSDLVLGAGKAAAMAEREAVVRLLDGMAEDAAYDGDNSEAYALRAAMGAIERGEHLK